jgi:hypothetical protein
MTGDQLLQGLQRVIASPVSLPQIASALREYRHQGVARQEVQSALEGLRQMAPDEATEDRILEVMDIVSGFCPREMTVWDD